MSGDSSSIQGTKNWIQASVGIQGETASSEVLQETRESRVNTRMTSELGTAAQPKEASVGSQSWTTNEDNYGSGISEPKGDGASHGKRQRRPPGTPAVVPTTRAAANGKFGPPFGQDNPTADCQKHTWRTP